MIGTNIEYGWERVVYSFVGSALCIYKRGVGEIVQMKVSDHELFMEALNVITNPNLVFSECTVRTTSRRDYEPWWEVDLTISFIPLQPRCKLKKRMATRCILPENHLGDCQPIRFNKSMRRAIYG